MGNKPSTTGFDQLKKNNKKWDLELLAFILPIVAVFTFTPFDFIFNAVGLFVSVFSFIKSGKKKIFIIQLVMNVGSLFINLLIVYS